MNAIISSINKNSFVVSATDYNNYTIRNAQVAGIEKANIALGSFVNFEISRRKIKSVTVTRIRHNNEIPECLVGIFFTVAERNFLPNISNIYR